MLAVVGDEGESAGRRRRRPPSPRPSRKDEEQAEKKAEQEQEIAEDKGELPAGDETPEPEQGRRPSQPSSRGGRDRPTAAVRPAAGRARSVTLPALGESVTEGTVTRWLKQVGDEVAVDEPLLEVSTDKVDTEIPSPVAGTLLEIKVEEDETVEVGAELAAIGVRATPRRRLRPATPRRSPRTRSRPRRSRAGAGDRRGRRAARRRRDPRAEAARRRSPPQPSRAASRPSRRGGRAPTPGPQGEPEPQRTDERAAAGVGAPRRRRRYVTPLVRKMAAQHGVDLARSAAPASVAGSASRTSSTPRAAGHSSRPSSPPPPPPAAPAAAARGRAAGRPERRPRRRCAARPRRCRGCARSSPSGWSTRCRRRPSSPRWWRST